jgi:hypothetical protein
MYKLIWPPNFCFSPYIFIAGLPDGLFSYQKNFGLFLVYFMAILVLLSPLGAFHLHLVYFVVIWYAFSHFGISEELKSGNPDSFVVK